MFTINIDKECGCFNRSNMKNNTTFESKDDALIEAKKMETFMNAKFCQRHRFTLSEQGENFQIAMNDRPKPAGATSGGCCGGGHCS